MPVWTLTNFVQLNNLDKENMACTEPLAKAEAEVALILLLRKYVLTFPSG